jgi:hypothetical protein
LVKRLNGIERRREVSRALNRSHLARQPKTLFPHIAEMIPNDSAEVENGVETFLTRPWTPLEIVFDCRMVNDAATIKG